MPGDDVGSHIALRTSYFMEKFLEKVDGDKTIMIKEKFPGVLLH